LISAHLRHPDDPTVKLLKSCVADMDGVSIEMDDRNDDIRVIHTAVKQAGIKLKAKKKRKTKKKKGAKDPTEDGDQVHKFSVKSWLNLTVGGITLSVLTVLGARFPRAPSSKLAARLVSKATVLKDPFGATCGSATTPTSLWRSSSSSSGPSSSLTFSEREAGACGLTATRC
jgi:hypothetical protein